jgi:hypothetical protein
MSIHFHVTPSLQWCARPLSRKATRREQLTSPPWTDSSLIKKITHGSHETITFRSKASQQHHELQYALFRRDRLNRCRYRCTLPRTGARRSFSLEKAILVVTLSLYAAPVHLAHKGHPHGVPFELRNWLQVQDDLLIIRGSVGTAT